MDDVENDDVRQMDAAYQRGLREGGERMRRELMEARAASYREGTAAEGLCGAPCGTKGGEAGVVINGVPVICMRPSGHPLGALDRHKAVFGEPHLAISWNDEEGEGYTSPMADPDRYGRMAGG